MTGEHAKKNWSRKRKLLLSLTVLVVLCLLAEAAARVRFYSRHGTFKRVHSFTRDGATGLPINEPNRDTGSLKTDSRGFRNPELEVPKPEGRIRIAFLGASTTFCGEASSNETTWPARVTASIAAAHPNLSIDYVNAGVPGYRIEFIQKNLELRVVPLAPDVIVLYEATNDLIQDTTDLAKAQGLFAGQADPDDVLADVSLLWYLIEKNLRASSREKAARAGAGQLAFDPATTTPRFREHYLTLVHAAQKVAPVVAVVTFSQRLRPEQSAEAKNAACITHTYYMPFMSTQALIAGFAAYNDAIRSVTRETGVILIEGENEIPGDGQCFADSVHFTDEGCRLQSERIVRGLESASAFQALIKR